MSDGFTDDQVAAIADRIAERLFANHRGQVAEIEALRGVNTDLVVACEFLLSNWPPNRDGMDQKPLPVGVRWVRKAVAFAKEAQYG